MLNRIKDYKFKNPDLLTRALTHGSYSKENYQRLEFLGDSILDFVVGDYLFKKCEEDEGKLTKLRASFVSEQYLCKIFDELEVEKNVLVGKSYKSSLSKALKCDIFEAIVAAIYLDGGFEVTKKFVIHVLKLGNYKTIKDTDYKSQLQELFQKQSKSNKVSYKLISQEGLSHDPHFKVAVLLNKEKYGEGEGHSKQEAEQQGAKIVLKKLKKTIDKGN